MAINLNIQAEVVDIRSDSPEKNDIFLVDTNVWLWQTYTKAAIFSQNVRNKISEYSQYLAIARSNGAILTYSGLILAELAHVIEKTEFKIFRQQDQSVKPKEYRHNYPNERANVVSEVQSAWNQVEAIAVSADLMIDEASTQAALARFQSQALDGYDLLLLESISRAGAGQIKVLTDDMDYTVVPGIQVFTSNTLVIQTATSQGKLIIR